MDNELIIDRGAKAKNSKIKRGQAAMDAMRQSIDVESGRRSSRPRNKTKGQGKASPKVDLKGATEGMDDSIA